MDDRIAQLVRQFSAGLKRVYGDRLRGVYLFGSYARGEQDAESDVDVAVVLDVIDNYGAEIDRTSYVTSELALAFGVSISRVFLSERDWAAGDSVFAANAKREAIPA